MQLAMIRMVIFVSALFRSIAKVFSQTPQKTIFGFCAKYLSTVLVEIKLPDFKAIFGLNKPFILVTATGNGDAKEDSYILEHQR